MTEALLYDLAHYAIGAALFWIVLCRSVHMQGRAKPGIVLAYSAMGCAAVGCMLTPIYGARVAQWPLILGASIIILLWEMRGRWAHGLPEDARR